MRTEWTIDEIDKLIKCYPIMTRKELLYNFDRSWRGINIKAHKLSLKKDSGVAYKCRTIGCNDKFFELPNLLNSYWAGFIAADGCVCKGKHLQIHISDKDDHLLLKLKEDINFKGTVKYYPARTSICKKTGQIYYTKPSCAIAINSKKVCNDLKNNFNIVERKSLILQPPNISGDNALAYIVGYIDGDGSICRRSDKYKTLSLKVVGNIDLLVWIKNIFNKIHSSGANIHKYVSISEYVRVGSMALPILEKLSSVFPSTLDRKWRKIHGC